MTHMPGPVARQPQKGIQTGFRVGGPKQITRAETVQQWNCTSSCPGGPRPARGYADDNTAPSRSRLGDASLLCGQAAAVLSLKACRGYSAGRRLGSGHWRRASAPLRWALRLGRRRLRRPGPGPCRPGAHWQLRHTEPEPAGGDPTT